VILPPPPETVEEQDMRQASEPPSDELALLDAGWDELMT
jgi:hypothetical protein